MELDLGKEKQLKRKEEGKKEEERRRDVRKGEGTLVCVTWRKVASWR